MTAVITAAPAQPVSHAKISLRRTWIRRHRTSIGVLAVLLIVVGLANAWNLQGWPGRVNDDEGTYVAEAWAMLYPHHLSHYTYWYDRQQARGAPADGAGGAGVAGAGPAEGAGAGVAQARDSVAPLIDAMLAEDLDAPRKQRHTARRAWCRLRDEHDAEVSYSYVAKYVARRRPEVEAEARGQAESLEGYVPQAKEPGAEAEVDFGPVTVVLDGRDADCHLFAYRLSYSGMGVHRVYPSCAQEALLEGHVTAFTVTGGVPREHIRYDNLTPAVTKVMKGRDRKENARWLSFRSWSQLTELAALFPQFTGQIPREVTTVSAHVRRREARPGSRGHERPPGGRAGRDQQPLGALPAA